MTLKKYDISEDIFNKIISDIRGSRAFLITSNIEPFFSRPIKDRIIYNGTNTMIIPEYILKDYIETTYNSWKQVILVKNTILENNIYEKSIDGSRAWIFMIKLLKKYYTVEEIDECLNAFQAEYDYTKAQLHYIPDNEIGDITIYDNCYKYDINGAHNEALTIIFPKAADEIIKMFNERKKNPVNKKYINFFVGMMCRKGYRKTYNWIVQRVSKTLKEYMLDACGKILYANTDGFIVQNPVTPLKYSTELGKIKLEYKGRIALYKDINYYCYQQEDGKITGNVRYIARDKIDLFNKKVVHYNLKKEYVDGEIIEHISDIREEIL